MTIHSSDQLSGGHDSKKIQHIHTYATVTFSEVLFRKIKRMLDIEINNNDNSNNNSNNSDNNLYLTNETNFNSNNI